ncbi:plasmid stabilization protein [Galbibacter sp. BG1]|uniref:type II toxin-antitoxin system RelE family toxin n=1 Tax=Galbibacter sp. BG1 TaxID=1170699 RepID=UPI0015BE352A|nr:plasmid stabilization protein [Galbibacter sp. BG1]QLE00812.1 plasmid stabilization protein [Galbibacter sp. BG1]
MTVKYKSSFLKDIKNIKDKKLKSRITDCIVEIKQSDRLTDLKSIKKLKGHQYAYRLRVGDYRIGLFLKNDVVELARVVKRNDIYKLFP